MTVQKKQETDSPIQTTADRLAQYVIKKKKVLAEDVAKAIGIKIEQVEKWANILEEHGIISVDYSTLHGMILKARLVAKGEVGKKLEEVRKKEEAMEETLDALEKAIKEEERQSSELEKEFIVLSEKIDESIKQTKKVLGILGGIRQKLKQRVKKDAKETERQSAHAKLLGLQDNMEKLRKEIVVSGKRRKKIGKDFKELEHDVSAFGKKVKKIKKAEAEDVEKAVVLLHKIEEKLKNIKNEKETFANEVKEIDGKIDAISDPLKEIVNKLLRLKIIK